MQSLGHCYISLLSGGHNDFDMRRFQGGLRGFAIRSRLAPKKNREGQHTFQDNDTDTHKQSEKGVRQ